MRPARADFKLTGQSFGARSGAGGSSEWAPACHYDRIDDMTDDDMTDKALTPRALDLAFSAWALSQQGQGMVIEDVAYPEAHLLAEKGWLARRIEPDGEMSWHWTHEGDKALALGALASGATRSLN